MLINGKRALAYTSTINDIKPIEKADRIELATVEGWTIVVKKDEFKIGDTCIFFEIDAKLPITEWSQFLASKNYKVKTMKLNKFGVWSQGLALPIETVFGEEKNIPIHTDLTDELQVTYSDAEDNIRKENSIKKISYMGMLNRHAKLFSKQPYKWLLTKKFGRALLFAFYGKKKDNKKGFPGFVKKTDEERIELLPHLLGQGTEWEAYEKLDGTSATYALKRKKFGRYEFYVCSRNVRQLSRDQECAHATNVYWEMADKYGIENKLKDYLRLFGYNWVAIQGEIVGNTQGNPLKLENNDLYVFNFITPVGRKPSLMGKRLIESMGMKWVPYLGTYTIANTMEEIKQEAEGKSLLNPQIDREGIVYRSSDGKQSFKNVSRTFLLKKG